MNAEAYATELIDIAGHRLQRAAQTVSQATVDATADSELRDVSPAKKSHAVAWALTQIDQIRYLLDEAERIYLQSVDGVLTLGRALTINDIGRNVYMICRNALGQDTGRRERVGKLSHVINNVAIVKIGAGEARTYVPYNLCDLKVLPEEAEAKLDEAATYASSRPLRDPDYVRFGLLKEKPRND